MRTIQLTKATKAAGRTYFGGTHIVNDAVAAELLASGNAIEKGAGVGAESKPAVASDHYGPTGVTHKEKTPQKAVKAKKEGE